VRRDYPKKSICGSGNVAGGADQAQIEARRFKKRFQNPTAFKEAVGKGREEY
jgi:hypothetical protein